MQYDYPPLDHFSLVAQTRFYSMHGDVDMMESLLTKMTKAELQEAQSALALPSLPVSLYRFLDKSDVRYLANQPVGAVNMNALLTAMLKHKSSVHFADGVQEALCLFIVAHFHVDACITLLKCSSIHSDVVIKIQHDKKQVFEYALIERVVQQQDVHSINTIIPSIVPRARYINNVCDVLKKDPSPAFMDMVLKQNSVLAKALFAHDFLLPYQRLYVLIKHGSSLDDKVIITLEGIEREVALTHHYTSAFLGNINAVREEDMPYLLFKYPQAVFNEALIKKGYVTAELLIEVLNEHRTHTLSQHFKADVVVNKINTLFPVLIRSDVSLIDALIAYSADMVAKYIKDLSFKHKKRVLKYSPSSVLDIHEDDETKRNTLWLFAIKKDMTLIRAYINTFDVNEECDSVSCFVERAIETNPHVVLCLPTKYNSKQGVLRALEIEPSLINKSALASVQTKEIAEKAVLSVPNVLKVNSDCGVLFYTPKMSEAFDKLVKDFDPTNIAFYKPVLQEQIIKRCPEAVRFVILSADMAMNVLPYLKTEQQKEWVMGFISS